MDSADALKDRWSGTSQVRARAIIERLITGEPLSDLGLSEHDGRTDLRGLWLVNSRGLPGRPSGDSQTTPTATGIRWKGIDLSSSTFVIHLRDADLIDVRLDRAGWRDWNVEASRLVGCSFAGAELGDVQFDWRNPGLQDRPSQGPSSRLVRCDFSRTRLGSYSGFGRADLDSCTFHGTRLPSPMWFRGASIRNCVFSGRFATVCFGWTGEHEEPAPFLDADVSDAEFESCEVYSHTGPGLR